MWPVITIVSVAWLLWVVGSVVALDADIREQKRPADAGVSVLPVIPLFPLLFVYSAWLIDRHAPPWGTRVVGGLHVVLTALYAAGIVRDAWRIRRSSRRPPAG